MGHGRQAIAIATAASLALAACGSHTPEGTFDPSTAEEFIRNKARADVVTNPALLIEQPEDPTVTCEEAAPGETGEEKTARFTCDVEIVDAEGESLGRQKWIADVELDAVTGDTVVRSSKRVSSTIRGAPSPLGRTGSGPNAAGIGRSQ